MSRCFKLRKRNAFGTFEYNPNTNTHTTAPRSSGLYGRKGGPDYPGNTDHREETPWYGRHTKSHHSMLKVEILYLAVYNNNNNNNNNNRKYLSIMRVNNQLDALF